MSQKSVLWKLQWYEQMDVQTKWELTHTSGNYANKPKNQTMLQIKKDFVIKFCLLEAGTVQTVPVLLQSAAAIGVPLPHDILCQKQTEVEAGWQKKILCQKQYTVFQV